MVRHELRDSQSLRQEMEGRCILVVDDETVIRDLCAKVLKGYRVLEAANGMEALEVLEREPADVILTDVMMPCMNGLDLLRTVKEREPNQAVVIMTGYADKEIILRALKADADDFISKPINLLQLKTTIDKVLEKRVLREELVQVKRMDRLKSDFLGLVSHKLKTPTTAISLFIQNLAGGIGDPNDPGFRQTLELILEEANYLNYLIQDLLYYSEIILAEGPLRPLPVDPRELVQQVTRDLQGDFAKKGIRLTLELDGEEGEVLLDRQRIGFVLRALLENSLKFTPNDGAVSLSCILQERELRLVVRDTGPGIPEDAMEKIFDKFYQVDPSHTGQVRGFGLGLFYARQFIQAHGGTLSLKSEQGLGTEATIRLPR